jgi:hypothetical protein
MVVGTIAPASYLITTSVSVSDPAFSLGTAGILSSLIVGKRVLGATRDKIATIENLQTRSLVKSGSSITFLLVLIGIFY